MDPDTDFRYMHCYPDIHHHVDILQVLLKVLEFSECEILSQQHFKIVLE